jgi:hypothetical protein
MRLIYLVVSRTDSFLNPGTETDLVTIETQTEPRFMLKFFLWWCIIWLSPVLYLTEAGPETGSTLLGQETILETEAGTILETDRADSPAETDLGTNLDTMLFMNRETGLGLKETVLPPETDTATDLLSDLTAETFLETDLTKVRDSYFRKMLLLRPTLKWREVLTVVLTITLLLIKIALSVPWLLHIMNLHAESILVIIIIYVHYVTSIITTLLNVKKYLSILLSNRTQIIFTAMRMTQIKKVSKC